MVPEAVNWLPGLFALGAGLAGGAFLVWLLLRRSRSAPVPSTTRGGAKAKDAAENADTEAEIDRRDHKARRDVLLAQLRELEDTAAKRSPEQLARERYALELETARVLRALDVGERALAARRPTAAPGAVTPVAAAPEAGRPALRGFLWGTGTAAAAGLLLFFVARASRPRQEGGSVTGNTPMDGKAAPAADAEEAQLRAAIQRNPDDLDARLELARHDLGRRDMMGVWNETQYVLERAPGHPRALSYQSLVRLAMGQPEAALKMVQLAVAKAPDLLEGYVHMTLILVRMGRVKDAEATIAAASKRFPGEAPMLGRLMAEMRESATAQAEPSPPDHADPHEDPQDDPHADPPDGIAAPEGTRADGGAARPGPGSVRAAPAAGARGDRQVSGTVDLDPSLKSAVPPGAVVFVTVRAAGFGAGPPMAAKRLVAASFPLRFEIGAADSMMGQPLPAEMLVEARLDADGDPISRSRTDPSARFDDVKAGTTDLRLVLRRPGGS